MTTTTIDELHGLLGRRLGPGRWIDVTQNRINEFADATGDRQWIHIDIERAKKESPFGAPIAHGYLTLSLLSAMIMQLLTVQKASMAVNYGLNKVRFPAPVPTGSRVRMTAIVASVEDVNGGVQIVLNVVVECTEASKPVCVAEPVFRYYR